MQDLSSCEKGQREVAALPKDCSSLCALRRSSGAGHHPPGASPLKPALVAGKVQGRVASCLHLVHIVTFLHRLEDGWSDAEAGGESGKDR